MQTTLDTTLGASSKAESALTPEGKKTIIAALLTMTIDMYDIYLPIISLAPAMIYFTPAGLKTSITSTLLYLTLAFTLLGRATGAFVFGHLGDTIGRRRTTLISIMGFGLVTFVMAALPGYEKIGLVGISLMVVLRFLCGIFLGGGYTAANPLAMEYMPVKKRGLFAGFVTSAYATGNIAICIVTAIVLYFLPSKGLDSPYVQWGWRIPFLAGFILAMCVYVYFKKSIPESKVWLASKKAKAPLKELFSSENRGKFWKVVVFMTGLWFILFAVVGTLPGMPYHVLGVKAQLVTNSLIGINVVLFFGWLFYGALGDKFSRRKVLIWIGIFGCTILPFLHYLLVSGSFKNTTQLIVLLLLIEVIAVPTFALPLCYITERFNTRVRASAYGVGYTLGLVIPSFYSFYMLALKSVMPYQYTPIVLFVVGGILVLTGVATDHLREDLHFADIT